MWETPFLTVHTIIIMKLGKVDQFWKKALEAGKDLRLERGGVLPAGQVH